MYIQIFFLIKKEKKLSLNILLYEYRKMREEDIKVSYYILLLVNNENFFGMKKSSFVNNLTS